MKHPPLKRHPALIPLSREHFNGLVQVRRLRAAAAADGAARRAALGGFVSNWEAEMAAHFDDEERLLGPLMTAADRERLLRDHADLRSLAAEARRRAATEDPAPDWLQDLATLLEQHIRWEERECYERLQRTAPGELNALIPDAKRIEQTRCGAAPRGGTDKTGPASA